MKALRAAVVATLALSLATSACKRTKKDPSGGVIPLLGIVQVEDLTPPGAVPPGVAVDTAALARDLRSKLLAAKVFAGDTPDGGADKGAAVARVRLAVALAGVEEAGQAAARTALKLRIDVRPSSAVGPHWNEDIEVGSETKYSLQPPPDQPAVFRKLLSRTIDDLLSSYTGRQRLWIGKDSEVRAVLAAADAGEMRLEAIRAAGERKITSEVPALLKLLSHEEEPIRDAALGALVEMREQRAVAELAKQRSMRDRREMRKILDAIATLGGQEAGEYLDFVADGHEDEEIRQMAKEARTRLQRREPKK